MSHLPYLPDVPIETIIETSFKDYHVKGFDYICLRRSRVETVKLYFFDGDVSKLPEVVNPHDHRYDFETMCVAGAVENVRFSRYDGPRLPGTIEKFERFEYRTPLLGGSGFQHVEADWLGVKDRLIAKPGQCYWMNAEELHTIRLVENETVIALVQHEDLVGDHLPTSTWSRDREPPDLTGLYNRFTADEVFAKLAALQCRAPGLILPRIA